MDFFTCILQGFQCLVDFRLSIKNLWKTSGTFGCLLRPQNTDFAQFYRSVFKLKETLNILIWAINFMLNTIMENENTSFANISIPFLRWDRNISKICFHFPS